MARQPRSMMPGSPAARARAAGRSGACAAPCDLGAWELVIAPCAVVGLDRGLGRPSLLFFITAVVETGHKKGGTEREGHSASRAVPTGPTSSGGVQKRTVRDLLDLYMRGSARLAT